jgi:uncharacterized protein YndB with AHSA1/START domain
MTFDVACSPEHAFATWTQRIATWWPADHTVSGQADTAVVLDPGLGGRIYERTAGGIEHDWGTVTTWDPPRRLGYRWHLGSGPTDATDVEIWFTARDEAAATTIRIEHRGWERLGPNADAWQERNRVGWETLLPHFSAAVEKEDR